MRKSLIAFTALLGLAALPALGTMPASAAGVVAVAPHPAVAIADPAIQQADWYCGPRCQYWRHQRWEEHRRWEERRRWEEGQRWRNERYRDYGWYR